MAEERARALEALQAEHAAERERAAELARQEREAQARQPPLCLASTSGTDSARTSQHLRPLLRCC